MLLDSWFSISDSGKIIKSNFHIKLYKYIWSHIFSITTNKHTYSVSMCDFYRLIQNSVRSKYLAYHVRLVAGLMRPMVYSQNDMKPIRRRYQPISTFLPDGYFPRLPRHLVCRVRRMIRYKPWPSPRIYLTAEESSARKPSECCATSHLLNWGPLPSNEARDNPKAHGERRKDVFIFI